MGDLRGGKPGEEQLDATRLRLFTDASFILMS